MKKRLVKFFVTQKFRFDMSAQFMVFVNFVLLSITAAPNIQDFFRNRYGWVLQQNLIIPVLIFIAFFGVWFFGYVLDKMEYWQEIRTVQTNKNPMFVKILQNTEDIKKEMDKKDG